MGKSIVKRISCGNGNCYLVSNGENAILVDTARPKYKKYILEACRGYNVTLIVLTHGHVDHIQNAAYLSKKLNAPIAMNDKDIPLIKNNFSEPLKARSFLGKIILAASIESFKKDPIDEFLPDINLEDGDTLEKYGLDIKIIDLQGHTKGSIGLDIDETNIIVGDALMNMFYPTVSMLYGNEENMIQSARKITELGNRKIYFGHGKPVNNRVWVK